MERIVDTGWWGRVDEYEVVEEFPCGYVVWNIGRHNFQHKGFVPLAKQDPNCKYRVLLDGLKALKCKDEYEALYIMSKASEGSKSIDIIEFNRIMEEYYESKD